MENKEGAITPEEALEYMKNTKGLVVIDVAAEDMYIVQHFNGAVSIPFDELEDRYNEIPANKPVLLHCRKGVLAPKAYELLKGKRPDIKELRYIAGAPLFAEYNKWSK